MTPTKAIDRACLQYATQVVLGVDAFYVTPDRRLLEHDTLRELDPSGSSIDAIVATLAAMMKLHLLGVSLGQLRADLIDAGVREQLANRVHDHLLEVSNSEWEGLRGRIRWYADEHTHDHGRPKPLNEV